MVLTTPNAELGGTLIDALVYGMSTSWHLLNSLYSSPLIGLYLSIFTHAVQVLYQRKGYNRTSTFLMVTTGALFCLITAVRSLLMSWLLF